MTSESRNMEEYSMDRPPGNNKYHSSYWLSMLSHCGYSLAHQKSTFLQSYLQICWMSEDGCRGDYITPKSA